jgi:hypothetical protein
VTGVHLPALDHGAMAPVAVLYAIRIYGHLGALVLSAFLALVPQRHGADTVLTGLLDRSALHGVLAEIGALDLDLLQGAPARNVNHRNQVTVAHLDGH